MVFDLSTMPTTFDLLHAILATLVFIMLFLLFIRKPQVIEKEIEVEKKVEVEVPVEKIVEVEKLVEVEKIVEKTVEVKSNLHSTNNDSALQLLALMQKESRLIDFLNEDLTNYSDEDVGAAVRVIHTGGQKLLKNYLTLTPIRSEQEETRISVEANFDRQQLQLIGDIHGEGPYSGTLIHKGWKVSNLELPQVSDSVNLNIIAMAEVEL